jgi:hypothetical protein
MFLRSGWPYALLSVDVVAYIRSHPNALLDRAELVRSLAAGLPAKTASGASLSPVDRSRSRRRPARVLWRSTRERSSWKIHSLADVLARSNVQHSHCVYLTVVRCVANRNSTRPRQVHPGYPARDRDTVRFTPPMSTLSNSKRTAKSVLDP